MADTPKIPKLRDLKTAREQLSRRYAASRVSGYQDAHEREAYVRARMPATHAAVAFVLRALPPPLPSSLNTCLDLGCGPGTATLAVYDFLRNADQAIPQFILMDQDAGILNQARAHCTAAKIPDFETRQGDIIHSDYPAADMVLLSYVLGEMTPDQQLIVLKKAYDATQHYLILVHPGTQALFHDFLTWHDALIQWGGHIIAPCPTHTVCPLSKPSAPGAPHPTGWCHFKTRLQRTKDLKYLKNATLGFEDEPLNYMIIAKHPTKDDTRTAARIITRPRKHTGHVCIDVCTGSTVATRIISKKHPHYAVIKKKAWGDVIAEDTST